MFLPLMPLGVEHLTKGKVKFSAGKVFLPLMPLGVEHMVISPPPSLSPSVFLPLMPLGVEHPLYRSGSSDPNSVSTFDAVRR